MKWLIPLFGLFTPVLAPAASGADAPAFAASIERLDPALDRLIPAGAQIENCAEGFTWSEGPVWFENALLFSDVPENIIYRWAPGDKTASVFLKPSGLLTPRPGFREQGSNGLAVDREGRLLICQHGERRVARRNADGTQTALASHFEGKRLNSPNDLALRKDGSIYFTDPPYGLDKGNASPLKELPFNGVFRISPQGTLSLLIRDLPAPNGIAFSPDEKTLYVALSDGEKPRIMAYDVQADGSAANGRLFFDATPLKSAGRKGSCDGMKVDREGNLFCTGPGGVLVLSPAGALLGILNTGQATANCAWGGNGSTLYITADAFLCRIQTATKGAGW